MLLITYRNIAVNTGCVLTSPHCSFSSTFSVYLFSSQTKSYIFPCQYTELFSRHINMLLNRFFFFFRMPLVMRISLEQVHLCFSALPVQHHRQRTDRSMTKTLLAWNVFLTLQRTFSSTLVRVGSALKNSIMYIDLQYLTYFSKNKKFHMHLEFSWFYFLISSHQKWYLIVIIFIVINCSFNDTFSTYK